MGYKIIVTEAFQAPIPEIVVDLEGTTSWRDVKKALRQWYLDRAKALRSVSEKEYFEVIAK